MVYARRPEKWVRVRPSRFLIMATVTILVVLASTDASALGLGDAAGPLEFDTLLQAPEGTDLSWDALDGQAVVMVFWSTECGPCVSAVPQLNEFVGAIQGEGEAVRLISITDEERPAVEAFLAKQEMRGWVGIDLDRSVAAANGVTHIPWAILVDGEGRVAGITQPERIQMVHLRRLAWGRPTAPSKTSPSAAPSTALAMPSRPTGRGTG